MVERRDAEEAGGTLAIFECNPRVGSDLAVHAERRLARLFFQSLDGLTPRPEPPSASAAVTGAGAEVPNRHTQPVAAAVPATDRFCGAPPAAAPTGGDAGVGAGAEGGAGDTAPTTRTHTHMYIDR